MKRIEVTLGQDSPSYATFSMEVPDGASKDEIISLIAAKANAIDDGENAEGIFYEDSFDFSGLRIVDVRGLEGISLNGTPIEVSPHDVGTHFIEFLAGRDSLDNLVGILEAHGVTVCAEAREALLAIAIHRGEEAAVRPRLLRMAG